MCHTLHTLSSYHLEQWTIGPNLSWIIVLSVRWQWCMQICVMLLYKIRTEHSEKVGQWCVEWSSRVREYQFSFTLVCSSMCNVQGIKDQRSCCCIKEGVLFFNSHSIYLACTQSIIHYPIKNQELNQLWGKFWIETCCACHVEGCEVDCFPRYTNFHCRLGWSACMRYTLCNTFPMYLYIPVKVVLIVWELLPAALEIEQV